MSLLIKGVTRFEELTGRWAFTQAHRGALNKIMVFQGPGADPTEEDKPTGDLEWARYLEIGQRHITSLLADINVFSAGDAPGAGRFYCQPFPIPIQMSFDELYACPHTGVEDKSFRLGIYDSAGSYPNNLLVDSGPIPSLPIEVKSVAIDLTLNAGLYWVVLICEDALIKFYYSLTTQVHPILGRSPFGPGNYDWTLLSTYGPLPDPFPAGASRQRRLYDMGLRRSA